MALGHHKRRLSVAALSAGVSVAVATHAPVAAVLSGLAAAVIAFGLILMAPGFRRWIEAASFGLILSVLIPADGQWFVPLWTALTSLCFALLYGPFVHSPLARALGFGMTLRAQRKFTAPHSAARLWAALIPGESHPDDYWTGTLADFDHDPDDSGTIYLQFETATGPQDATLTILDQSAPTFCRYFLESVIDGAAHDSLVCYDLVETATGKTDITATVRQDDVPPPLAFARWFDDDLGQELDRLTQAFATPRNRAQTAIRPQAAASLRQEARV